MHIKELAASPCNCGPTAYCSRIPTIWIRLVAQSIKRLLCSCAIKGTPLFGMSLGRKPSLVYYGFGNSSG